MEQANQHGVPEWAEAAFPINIVCEAVDCGVRLQVNVRLSHRLNVPLIVSCGRCKRLLEVSLAEASLAELLGSLSLLEQYLGQVTSAGSVPAPKPFSLKRRRSPSRDRDPHSPVVEETHEHRSRPDQDEAQLKAPQPSLSHWNNQSMGGAETDDLGIHPRFRFGQSPLVRGYQGYQGPESDATKMRHAL
eukprot:jgi/Botrbrau1/507/Bobra.110_2s0137.2